MAGSAYLSGLETAISSDQNAQRHSGVVRITHWINTLSFFGLLVSGFAILLAHPRFYWGETGALGTPSLIDLPLPFMTGGPSGWGRNLHFLSAWVCVINGSFYAVSSILTRHFRKDLCRRKPIRVGLRCAGGRIICALGVLAQKPQAPTTFFRGSPT
jgi:cytochrome b subunit of formate dehydrogenase